jgi:UDP:flavonoid glycosyltransferase YjiC (YdhE family)
MKPRILFIGEAVTLAHVMRPYLLAQSLNLDDYEVHFAANPRYNKLFKATGVNQIDIHSQTPETFQKKLWLNQPVFDFDTLDEYIRTDLQIINDIKPDLIVSDFRISMAISARLSRVPLATITNAYWTRFYKTHYPASDNIGTQIFGKSIFESIFNKYPDFFFNLHAQNIKKVAQKWKCELPFDYNVLDFYTDGDYRLFADYPEMLHSKVDVHSELFLAKNHHFLGSFIWSPNIELPEWWDKLPKENFNIYLNLGSSGKQKTLPLIIEALIDLPVNLITATVKEQKLPIHPYVFCSNFLPGLEVAFHSQLMICNGGSPSTQTALYSGIPCIGIPNNLDQYLNIQMTEAAGLGSKIRSDNIKNVDLKGVVMSTIGSGHLKKQILNWQVIAQNRIAQNEFGKFLEKFFGISLQKSMHY